MSRWAPTTAAKVFFPRRVVQEDAKVAIVRVGEAAWIRSLGLSEVGLVVDTVFRGTVSRVAVPDDEVVAFALADVISPVAPRAQMYKAAADDVFIGVKELAMLWCTRVATYG